MAHLLGRGAGGGGPARRRGLARLQRGAEEVMEGTEVCAGARRAAHGGGLRRKRAERKQRERGEEGREEHRVPREAGGGWRACSSSCSERVVPLT